MRRGRAAAAAILWLPILGLMGTPAIGHRLDEYLQATLLSVEPDRVELQLRLTPGVAVFPVVLAGIDADADGLISHAEQTAYAEKVIRDLSLTIDGEPLRLKLHAARFPQLGDMREGLGEMQFEFRADLPGGTPGRRLVFQNRHQKGIAAYLANSLVPSDPRIRLTAQTRNEDQSVYQVDFVHAGGAGPWSFAWWTGGRTLIAAAALLLLTRLGWLWRTGGILFH